MSKTTLALETAVAAVIVNSPKEEGAKPSARQRLEVDRAFARIMSLIAPRVRHFIRQYGLVAHWEDAEQACAIAVYRAIQAYDPAKAQFTTFVNWQIRGELQSLRFRLMTDQRPSAKKVEATTISINASVQGPEGEEATLESVIEDENALAMTEAGASDYLAASAIKSLTDSYIEQLRSVAIGQLKRRPRPKRATPLDADGQPRIRLRSPTHGIAPEEIETLEQRLKRNREIVERRLFEMSGGTDTIDDAGVTKERVRQITKRAAKTMGEIASTVSQYNVMAEYRRPGPLRPRTKVRAEAGGAPANPCPPIVILPETRRPKDEWLYVMGGSFDLAALEANEMAAGAMRQQSVLRH
jgi:DNA-directed RNA polymerase specialized sigma subunit